jgi:serine/threonine-protein kinase
MPDLREELQSALGSAYTVERELAGGGMSRVFVAEDTSLRRRVVIKVLAPELAAGVSAERFAREIQLAATLQQANMVPLLAAGRIGDLPYYSMPFVDGLSLRARLAEQGALSISESLSVLRDVARALAYAHDRGIVHRDIKPENILLSGGAAVVADFGIAKALHASRTAGTDATTLTQLGTALGTPAYMAPEQAAGDPASDQRADLYALGAVGYEMLTGAPPFAHTRLHELIAAHMTQVPAPVSMKRPDCPPRASHLIARCLAKDPDQRPASAREMLEALDAMATPAPRAPQMTRRSRGFIGAVIIGVAMLGGAFYARARRPSPPQRPVLVVLPFENLGPAADAYFADGLTDEVRGRLAGIAGLRVIGGTSARQYKGTTKSPREIARELGATHLLTASVRWERTAVGGGRVRVSAELVRAADQASVWAEPVEGSLDDVFAMQARVAERVTAALDLTLLAGERRAALPAPPTQNPAAYDAYLRGLAYGVDWFGIASPAAEQRAAAESFQQAIALDPTFAAAHARLAVVYLNEWNGSQDSTIARARASAARAMALDSMRVESRLAQASVLAATLDPAAALRTLEAAARIAPSSAEVQYQLGLAYTMLGHPEESVPSFQRAALLEPRWATPVGELASSYDQMFRYEEAIRTRERQIQLSTPTGAAYARAWQARAYLLWRGDTTVARRQLESEDPEPALSLAIRAPNPMAGYAIWLHVFPPAVLTAKDTITLAGYVRGDWATPEFFQLMKARHFWLTGRPDRARAHADSLIALLEPVLRAGAERLSSTARGSRGRRSLRRMRMSGVRLTPRGSSTRTWKSGAGGQSPAGT